MFPFIQPTHAISFCLTHGIILFESITAIHFHAIVLLIAITLKHIQKTIWIIQNQVHPLLLKCLGRMIKKYHS